MSRKRYLIIGDGAAGTTAAQRLRELDPQAYVTILSDDPNPAYFRSALTNYLLGELREEQIFAVPPSFYGDYEINRVLARVATVDAARKQLWVSQSPAPLDYDALLIASGARANAPAFEGAHLPGVMTMRTLQDVRAVMDLCRSGLSQALVIGGGPLALEWAHGMAIRGAKITMVIRETRFLPGSLDAVASDLLFARLRQGGVDVRMGETVAAVIPGRDGRVAGVHLASGAQVQCQLVAAAIGVACNTEFLHNTGIQLSPNRAILVDDRLRTSAPGVFAAGDCAAVNGKVLQLWEPARVQGRIAARNMTRFVVPEGGAGSPEEVYTPGAHYMATRLYDLDCAAVGESTKTPQGAEEVVDFPQRTGRISYRKLVFQGGRLVGALLFGQREERVRNRGRAFKTLIDQGADVRAIQRELLDPTFDLPGYLKANQLIEKPPVSVAATNVAALAKVKGTQMALSVMPDMRGSMPPPAAGAVPLGNAPTVKAAPGSFGAGGTSPEGAPAPAAQVGDAVRASVVAKPKPGTMVVPIMPGKAPDLTGVVLQVAGGGAFTLKGQSAIIGRDPSVAVVLADPMVSSTHAQLSRSGDAVYLRDLGSSNGTWVNGAPVTVPRRLKGGDHIRIGSTELIASIDGVATASSLHGGATGLPADARPHLEVRSGNAFGLAFVLTPPVVRVGRDPQCAVRLDDSSVSPFHAELREQNGVWHLADAQSAYGTALNGQRLAVGQWVALAEGAMIHIGQVALVFTSRPTKFSAWADMSIVQSRAGGPGGA